MRNLFVKGLFAASAVMMLASCNNEEGMDIQNGATSTVTVGVSMLTPASKAYTGEQLNQGDAVQSIADVAIVPMENDRFTSSAIRIGTVSANETGGKSVEKEISTRVNRFLVYGNVPADKITGIQAGGFTLEATKSTENFDTKYQETLYAPYGLYYYKDADVFDVATSENAWASVTNWTEDYDGMVGTNNRVRIKDVTYKVGVLGAGLMLDLESINDKTPEKDRFCFEPADGGDKVVYGDIAGSGTMDLKGLVIQGQPASFNQFFEQSAEDVSVFAAATNTTLRTEDLVFETSTNKVKGANIYSVVAEEDDDVILISFQFQNNTGYTLYVKDEEGELTVPIANGEYVYYSTELDARAPRKIFEAGYTTLLNATISHWGNGTPSIPTTTDVQIGVTIKTDWAQGIAYEATI